MSERISPREQPLEPPLPSRISELIANINKPFKGMGDRHNPDGTKFSRKDALRATREHVTNFALEYLPEVPEDELYTEMLGKFKRILSKKYRDEYLKAQNP